MTLQLVGCSHHRCSVETREKMAISEGQMPATLARFQSRFPQTEAVLLSTCNRTEIYTASTPDGVIPSTREIAEFLAEDRGLSGSDLLNELFEYSGEDAIRHLFTVAASLDSMVLGESQILAQVKQAYRLASEGKSAGQWTHAAFQNAIHVATRVANETGLHRKRTSIASVAIGGFARQIFDRLDDKSVLVIGAGEMGEESIQYLQQENARQITIVNRSRQRATDLAQRYQGAVADWDDLDELLVNADLVISTTGAEETVVSRERFDSIAARRHQRPLFIVDLAMPRDFDSSIANCIGVYLYSLDDLQEVCDTHRAERAKELPAARKIVDAETERFMRELQHRATGPTIKRLKQSAAVIRDSELKRLLNRLEGIDPDHQTEIEKSFQRLVNKILHPPLESLKEESGQQDQANLLDALKKLFRL